MTVSANKLAIRLALANLKTSRSLASRLFITVFPTASRFDLEYVIFHIFCSVPVIWRTKSRTSPYGSSRRITRPSVIIPDRVATALCTMVLVGPLGRTRTMAGRLSRQNAPLNRPVQPARAYSAAIRSTEPCSPSTISRSSRWRFHTTFSASGLGRAPGKPADFMPFWTSSTLS